MLPNASQRRAIKTEQNKYLKGRSTNLQFKVCLQVSENTIAYVKKVV